MSQGVEGGAVGAWEVGSCPSTGGGPESPTQDRSPSHLLAAGTLWLHRLAPAPGELPEDRAAWAPGAR